MKINKCADCGVPILRRYKLKVAKCKECAYMAQIESARIRRKENRATDDEYRRKEIFDRTEYMHKNSHSDFVGQQRKWKDEEAELLKGCNLEDRVIAKMLSRSLGSIREKRKRMGITKTDIINKAGGTT